ncbi:hypothetical protein [Laceyella putida]|uniref:Uncharacterized protein n=1 Tax=Laceyella putida TaxID=110101 RepID=A0ABW2RQK0_9BACL
MELRELMKLMEQALSLGDNEWARNILQAMREVSEEQNGAA